MSAQKITIGLWGTPRAGKTTYLAMLYHSFLTLHDQWEIHAEPEAMAFIKHCFETIFVRRSFPEKTIETVEYVFTVTNKQNTRLQFDLTFIDAPGELYERYYDTDSRTTAQIVPQSSTAERRTSTTPQQMFEKLSACDGLLMLIDPVWQTLPNLQNMVLYGSLLFDVLNDLKRLRLTTKGKAPLIGLCMTKADGNPTLYSRVVPSPLECYRNTPYDSQTPVTHRPTCEGRCPIFDQIGKVAMRDQLPSVQPNERVQCFLLSSIGRVLPANTSNVSNQLVWNRPITPTPPSLYSNSSAHEDYHPQLMARDTFEPDSICDPNAIEPRQLLDPIIWMMGVLMSEAAKPSSVG